MSSRRAGNVLAITADSVKRLGLKVGDGVTALVKASSVMVGTLNRNTGKVVSRIEFRYEVVSSTTVHAQARGCNGGKLCCVLSCRNGIGNNLQPR